MDVKKRKIRIAALVLSLALAMTSVFALPVMADSEEGPAGGGNPTEQTGDETESGGDQGEETPRELTPAEKEAAAIAKYGTYKGANASKIPVITYHRIVTDKQKKKGQYRRSSLAISKSTFNKQMRWLHNRGYRTINCEEFYLWHQGKIRLPKKSVLITFDDGFIGVAENALPVLRQYGMKGTSFLIGRSSYIGKKKSISYAMMKSIQNTYPDLEFQSHTFNLHKHVKKKGIYAKAYKDAMTQKSLYGFEYLAYPYGKYYGGMISAYKNAGIKMAFTYGKNGYATRKQNLYKIRRIKISGTGSFKQFKKWFK